MTFSPDMNHSSPQIQSGGDGFVMDAKAYPTGRGKFVVQLHWAGTRYRRYHYDNRLALIHRDMAGQIAGAINADIKKKGKHFDPRQWFKTSGYEFQFDQYAAKWITRNTHYAPAVRQAVRRYVGDFIDYFKKTDIREIKKGHIEDFLEQLPGHLAPKTKANILGLLHKLFADAFDQEMIERIPGWPRIEVPQIEVKWISREWQDRIIAEIPGRHKPIFIFLRTWGVRPGEARALMWDCIDFEKEIITIRRTFSGSGCNHLQEYTKTKRVRYLPFTPELRDVFNHIRGLGGFVFRNRLGRPYTNFSRIWNEARDRADAPKVTLVQGTRHSFATQHLDQLDLVSVILGHTTTNMTRQRYQGLNLEKIQKLGE